LKHDQDELSELHSSLKKQEIMTTAEAADYLRIPKASLLNLSSNGKVPYYKFQRRNRYLKSDLLKLLLSNKRGEFSGN
jgi:excisionase family DNA binding protein